MTYLFDTRNGLIWSPQNYRRTDQDTSKAAGEQHEASGDAEAQRYHVIQYVRHHPGCTAKECERSTRIAAHKRMKEIEQQGQIKRGPARKCRVTGKTATTWEPVN